MVKKELFRFFDYLCTLLPTPFFAMNKRWFSNGHCKLGAGIVNWNPTFGAPVDHISVTGGGHAGSGWSARARLHALTGVLGADVTKTGADGVHSTSRSKLQKRSSKSSQCVSGRKDLSSALHSRAITYEHTTSSIKPCQSSVNPGAANNFAIACRVNVWKLLSRRRCPRTANTESEVSASHGLTSQPLYTVIGRWAFKYCKT